MNERNQNRRVYPAEISGEQFIRNGLILFVIIFGGQLGFRYFDMPAHLISLMGTIVLPPLTYLFWRGVQQREDAVANADGVTLFLIVGWLVLATMTLLSWPR